MTRGGNKEAEGGEEAMAGKKCLRCGKELSPGSLFYVVHIQILSGFDGILLESSEGIDQHLRKLLEQVQHSDPEELEKEVYEELTLIVCKSCRDRLVEDVQHPWEGPFQIRKHPDSIRH